MAMVLRVQEEIINIRKMMVFINLKRSRFGVCFCVSCVFLVIVALVMSTIGFTPQSPPTYNNDVQPTPAQSGYPKVQNPNP
jgi:hypothetical protein